MRKIPLDKSWTGTFIGIDELRSFTVGLCSEQNMNMVNIVVPFD